MNYYREEYEATSNPLEKRLLSLADELLTFYMSNEAPKILGKNRRISKCLEGVC